MKTRLETFSKRKSSTSRQWMAENNPPLAMTSIGLNSRCRFSCMPEQRIEVLGQNAKTGSVHLLKDGQRIEVPITEEAVNAAL